MKIRASLTLFVLLGFGASICCCAQVKPSDEVPLLRADDRLSVFFHQLATLDDDHANGLRMHAPEQFDTRRALRPDEIATLANAMHTGNDLAVDAALEISTLYLRRNHDKATQEQFARLLPVAEASFLTTRPSNTLIDGANLADASHKVLVLGFIRALGKQPDPQAVSWMVTTLKTYKPNVNRTEIIESLANLSPMREDALDALVSALDRTSDGSGGIDPIVILGEIAANHLDHEKIRSAVMRALHSPVPAIQEAAVGSVSALHMTEAEPALRSIIATEPNLPVAYRAADALEALPLHLH